MDKRKGMTLLELLVVVGIIESSRWCHLELTRAQANLEGFNEGFTEGFTEEVH